MLVYRPGLDMSSSQMCYLADMVRAAIGSCWRLLSAGRQALPRPARLRNGAIPVLGSQPDGIGITTAYRYITDEAEELLASHKPCTRWPVRPQRRCTSAGAQCGFLRIEARDICYSVGADSRMVRSMAVRIAPSAEGCWVLIWW